MMYRNRVDRLWYLYVDYIYTHFKSETYLPVLEKVSNDIIMLVMSFNLFKTLLWACCSQIYIQVHRGGISSEHIHPQIHHHPSPPLDPF